MLVSADGAIGGRRLMASVDLPPPSPGTGATRIPPPLAAAPAPFARPGSGGSLPDEGVPVGPITGRQDLDEQVRALLARSDATLRQRAERRAFDERVVKVLQLLAQLDDRRRFVEERVAVLEDRLAVLEHISADVGDLALSRTVELGHRMVRVERSLIGRRHSRES